MKILPALPSLAAACALCACGTYVNPCGSGSPNNPTCPVQGGSSSSSSSSGGASSGSSSGAASAAQAAFSIAGATYLEGAGAAPAAQALRGTVRRIGAAGRWQALGAAQTGAASLVLGTGAGGDTLRLELSPAGWQYRDLGAGGAQAQGPFAPALEAGTEYWFELALGADQRTLTLTLPGGSVQIDDPAAAAQLGSDASWRALPAAEVFDFAAVWAAEDGQAAVPAAVYKAYDPVAAGQ